MPTEMISISLLCAKKFRIIVTGHIENDINTISCLLPDTSSSIRRLKQKEEHRTFFLINFLNLDITVCVLLLREYYE